MRIRAAVTRGEAGFCAHAIISPENGCLWSRSPRGSAAEASAGMRLACFCLAFGAVGLFAFNLMHPVFDSNVDVVKAVVVIGGLSAAVMALSTHLGRKKPPDTATEAFRLFGFADPETVDLSRYRYDIVHLTETAGTSRGAECRNRDVYCFDRAIDDGALVIASAARETRI